MSFNGNIAKVLIVFENCESFYVEQKDILWMHIGDIKTKVFRYSNVLSIENVAGQFGIALRKEIETEFWGNQTLLNRLDMRDVTNITLYDVNNESVSYVVEWADYSDQQTSINQRTFVTPDGNIVFVSTTSALVDVDVEHIDLNAKYMS